MSELEEQTLQVGERSEGGARKPRRVDGWAEEKGKRRRDTVEEDERLKVPETLDDDDDDLPVIPDLEAVQEENLTTQIAAPPSLTVNRLATYKQLEADLQKHQFTLDGNIDLKLLAEVLSPEDEVTEEEGVWEWERVFVEMSSDIKRVWGSRESANCSQQETAKEELTP